ncbi:MAG TPA: type II toxin-antitoxin system VapC family toxin [Terriglobales bacterium]|jgi:PIN domain nuclease of toxin-antitoxin system|nr:type II toxin-antitoxin system VapC family toxin [Terriglobales bacterium]
MNTVVLDASAILVALNSEPGSEKLTPAVIEAAVSSAVNLAEVQARLVDHGMDASEAWEAALSSVNKAVDFTVAHAEITGNLVSQTRSLGLSLGDRACLALGISLGAPIYTADKSWKNLKLPIKVHVIR